MEKTLLISCLFTALTTTDAIVSPVCDCTNVKTRGILDINSPYYCDNPTTHHQQRFFTNYTLMTKQKSIRTWKGWTCKQWVKTKKITGSFWIGSFDTVYSKEAKPMSSAECWEMINEKKCGGNQMQITPTTLSFIATPTGEGKWYAIKEYHALNCLAEEITLIQETPESLVESPFGFLNVTQSKGEYLYNQNNIVWKDKLSMSSYSKIIFKGEGYLELTQTNHVNISRLLDSQRQIEISFFNKPDYNNNEMAQPGFKVVGMPKTFLVFPGSTTTVLYKNFKLSLPSCKGKADVNILSCNEYATETKTIVKRSVGLLNIIYAKVSIRSEFMVNDNQHGAPFLFYLTTDKTLSDNKIGIYTIKHATEISKTKAPAESYFESMVDGTIRTKGGSNCVTSNEADYVTIEPCRGHFSKWTFSWETNQIMSREKRLCMTLETDVVKLTRAIVLKSCNTRHIDVRRQQQWIMETINDITVNKDQSKDKEIPKTHSTLKEITLPPTTITTRPNTVTTRTTTSARPTTKTTNTVAITTRTTEPSKSIKKILTTTRPTTKIQNTPSITRKPVINTTTRKVSSIVYTPKTMPTTTSKTVRPKVATITSTMKYTTKSMPTTRSKAKTVPATIPNVKSTTVKQLTTATITSTKQKNATATSRPVTMVTQTNKATTEKSTSTEKITTPQSTSNQMQRFSSNTAEKDVTQSSKFIHITTPASPLTRKNENNNSTNSLDTISKMEPPTQKTKNIHVKGNTKILDAEDAKWTAERTGNDYPVNDGKANDELPQSVIDLTRRLKYEVEKMHEQYKISIETEHENKLAKEIRDVYCQLSKIKRTQAITLAQTNGILAAAALNLPRCTRIYGFGQAMTLQQCDPVNVLISAKETKCGFQPFFVYNKINSTIGTDGWSIHSYSDCFWKNQLININGYPHAWEHNETAGDWIKQEATIHTPNLDLIAEFDELHLNNFDYALKTTQHTRQWQWNN